MPLNYDPTAPNFVGDNLNNDAFYKVVMNGEFAGQANTAIFYYRVGLGGLPGGINFGGAEILATLFREHVWADNLMTAYHNTYTLVDISVYPYNAQFDLMYSTPFILPVNETGENIAAPSGSAPCAIVAYNLEPTALGVNGFFPPKRAYSAFGPTYENDTDHGGRFTPTARSFYASKFAACTDDLVSLLPPITYWPIRIAQKYVLGVPVLQGFADIAKGTPTCRSKQSFRRSRVQEG